MQHLIVAKKLDMQYNPINSTKLKTKLDFDYVALGHIHKKRN
jgi:DNA repair exonuclease SbcCD nuclease subunit